MSTAKFDTLSNLAGTQTVPVATVAQGSAKAWVNFNGTGTVAIRASFNVSSITDNGVGNYTTNFTNAMPDTSYAVSLCNGNLDISPNQGQTFIQTRATTSLRTQTSNYGYISGDSSEVTVTIFR